ncbi:hypothetical protein BJX99DRAFT_227957 [Aspergillus californicus]
MQIGGAYWMDGVSPSRRSHQSTLPVTLKQTCQRRFRIASGTDLAWRTCRGFSNCRIISIDLGSLEHSFGNYIRGLIQSSSESPGYSMCRIESPSFRCLLPLGLKELSVDSFTCSSLQIYLRDGREESADEWANTMQYVVQRLHGNEISRTWRWGPPVEGVPVIVAFTRRVKIFYYVLKRVDMPSRVATSVPHCVDMASKCMETDPKCRLVNLTPGNEPLSLDDKVSREIIESWVQSFRNIPNASWDPFVAEWVPVVSTKDEDNDGNDDTTGSVENNDNDGYGNNPTLSG